MNQGTGVNRWERGSRGGQGKSGHPLWLPSGLLPQGLPYRANQKPWSDATVGKNGALFRLKGNVECHSSYDQKNNTTTQKTMKQILAPFRILSTIALLALAVGCANTRSKEDSLVAAGFRVSVPKTAAQQQKLKSLPPDKVTVVQKDGKTYYVFPDVARNLAYVGGPKEYETYHQIRSQKKKFEEIQWKENAEQIDWGGWGS